jgi:hypothetical protein
MGTHTSNVRTSIVPRAAAAVSARLRNTAYGVLHRGSIFDAMDVVAC